MNAAERSQLQQVLHGRCEDIADRWYQAIVGTSYVPLEAAKLRRHLVEWTEQAITLLLAEPFERGKGQAIGAALARLHCIAPECLGRTQETLACQLVEGLPVEQAVALQPRLAALLGGVAAGFHQQARETILAEQEQIRSALITERKQAEETLRESEERYRAIFEQAADSILLVDAETGALVAFNDRAHENLGYTREEFEKLKIPDFEVIESAKEVAKHIEKIIKEGADIFETKHRTKSGEIRDILASSRAISIGGRDFIQSMWSDITERKRAEEEIRQRTAQLEALQQVSLGLTAQLELDALLRSIVARAIALLGGTSGGLYLYRPEQDVLEWTVTIGPHLTPTGTILRRGEGLSGKVWESGEPLIVDDYQHWKRRAAAYEGYPFTSVVGVPVRWGGESLGVLNVLALPPRTFSPADAELLSLFATQAAIAIENARLFQGEQAQRELSKALEEAAVAVSSTLDLDQVLDHILEQVERVVAGDAFSVILIEDDSARLARWRGYELPGEETQPFRFEIPVAKYPNLMKMARTGEPVVVLDTLVDPNWVPAARDQGWRRSYVGAPIQVGGVTVGFLNVSGTRPGQFGPDDAQRLQAFANHAATAIENARLFQAEREQRELAEALAEAAAAVGSTLDLDQVLFTVLEEMRHLLDVVACSVWLIEPETNELICRQAVGPQSEIVRGWRLALGEGIAGWVARSGKSLIVPDVRADERHFKGVDQQTGLALRSILSVPLRSKKDVIGVLQVVDTEVDRFSSTDLTLLEPLAASAAIAIENARLYEQARRDAKLKTALLNEVNHRVHNNLAAIIGLLYAERRHIGTEDQAVYQSIMQDLVNRVQGLSTVHSLLSATEWAPLRLSELATQVISSSLRALPRGKRVSVDVSPSPIRVTSDQAHNLALVINELTTNTVKHALRERDTGHITVRIALEDASVLFEFRDDGPGHPEEALQLEHHTVGFDLIQTLVRHGLRGEVTLHNDHGAVTIVRFKTME